MSVLPDEIWRCVMEIGIQTKSIDYKSLCCLSIACRRFRRLANEDSLWSQLLLSDFSSSVSDLIPGDGDRKVGNRNSNRSSSSSTSKGKLKSHYRISPSDKTRGSRYEKDREKRRLAHRRAVLRIESRLAEHMRKIRVIELESLEEKENMNKVVAELLNLRRIRQASVAINVWQPEIIRSRQRQMVQQTNVPVDVRINALEMELSLCKQQIAGFDKAIREERRRRRAAEEELASVKYHPLLDSGESSRYRVRSKKLKDTSTVKD